MKKIISTLLIILLALSLFACSGEIRIKQYTGTPLTQLKYVSIDYNGGHTSEYVFDFNKNSVEARSYMPIEYGEPEFVTVTEFNDEQEKLLIDKLYTYGLFNINKRYESPEGIMDGGGWNLEISYADGTNKLSSGSNNGPSEVFSDCAKAFFDMCGQGIVAYVPQEYYIPPNLSFYSISYTVDNTTKTYDDSSIVKRGNYKWNGFEETSLDILELNREHVFPYELNDSIKYNLSLYAAPNSGYGDYDKFKKCTVTSYDCDNDLSTGEKIIEKGWFLREYFHIDFDLELNKIYVIKLSFSNGDFVEYTFNTRV